MGSSKLWGSRFDKDVDELALDYTETTEIDARMLRHEIFASLAHALMLARREIVPAADARLIVEGLLGILELVEAGRYPLDKRHEDVHLNLENALIERLGREVGGKLHTARSRNDQVVTDARLYTRERLLEIAEETAGFARELLERASTERDTLMLGYTHSQAAQPITLGFWLSAHASALLRDTRRLLQAHDTVNQSPLGACALAGTRFPIDRDLTARLLGFDRVLLHALDATSTRDFLEESLAVVALLAAHLSRLGEEIVVWSGFEHGLVEVGDAFATGSSIMPQKKNPVVAELARARAGTALGALVELLTVVKSVPLGYSSDLQQDKPPAWRSLDTVLATVRVLRAQSATLRFDAQRSEKACWQSFSTATELANHLVQSAGWAFRDAYRVTGLVVKALSQAGSTFEDADAAREALRSHGVEMTREELLEVVDPRKVVRRQISAGATGPEAVAATVEALRKELVALADIGARKLEAHREALESLRKMALEFSRGAERSGVETK